MSTLPIGRGMEMMDWVGVAGVGINLLMLTLAQRGKVDTDLKGKEKGKAPNNKTWAADRPVPLAINCVGGILGTISAAAALFWPMVVLMGLWFVSSAYNLARVLMAKRDIRAAAAIKNASAKT